MAAPPALALACLGRRRCAAWLAAGPCSPRRGARRPAAAAGDRPPAEVIVSHGISAFGDLKYPADFPHFDYVNPDAPKGGTMSFRGTGASQTFDSLNAFILKGEPAQGLGLLYDSLLAGSADEPDAAYGLVAESLEYPEDRSWVIFNMRPEATLLRRHADHRRGRGLHLAGAAREGRAVLPDHPQGHRRASRRSTPHRVKFTFKAGAPKRDLPALAGGLSILPKHYYDDRRVRRVDADPAGRLRRSTSSPTSSPGRSISYCRTPTTGARTCRSTSAPPTSTATSTSTSPTTPPPSRR